MTPPSRTALLLIDIQQGFSDPQHWGSERSTPDFEQNIAALLAAFRTAGAHVLHVCHYSTFEASPLHPSKDGARFMSYATPIAGEAVFPKSTNSPFIETDLEQVIRAREIERLVIVGLMTAHCVATTLRAASNMRVVDHDHGCVVKNSDSTAPGAIILVHDATATFNTAFAGKQFDAETVHAVHIASMRDEFCDVESTAEVITKLK